MFKSFLASQRGNIAIATGLILPALISVMGGAVDYAKLTSERTRLQGALDNTILAAAAGKFGPLGSMDEAAAKAYLQEMYAAAGGEHSDTVEFDLGRMSDEQSALRNERENSGADDGDKVMTDTMKKYVVWGTAGAEVDTMFLSFVQKLAGSSTASASEGSSTPVAVYSEALAGIHKNLEIVLVLDNTGSMASRHKMDILKTAAGNFATSMKELAQNSEKNSIKLGLVPFSTALRFEANIKNKKWVYYSDKSNKDGSSVCLWDRPGELDATIAWDGTSKNGFPATEDYYVNNSLYVQKHCDLAHVVELTDNASRVGAGINAMKASGNTNIGLGLNWGWQLLDPAEPFTEGAAMDDMQTLKVIILLTDGENTFNRRGYNATYKSFNGNYRDVPTKANCDALKQTPIKVYTIRVVDGNKNLLKNCATEPDMYYDVQKPEDMNLVFEQIAAHIRQVRLTF